jgi:hypothetical protein
MQRSGAVIDNGSHEDVVPIAPAIVCEIAFDDAGNCGWGIGGKSFHFVQDKLL